MAGYDQVIIEQGTSAGRLGLIQEFVNTIDREGGREQFSGANALGAWMVGRGLMEPGEPAGDADLKHTIALREAIRGVIGANSGAPVYPVDIATLNGGAVASRLRARFGADGKARLEPEAGGIEGALGRIIGAVFAAVGEKDWIRLKLCSSRACRRVFYDSSRNHSSRWCKMASCGNRQKAKRFRERARATRTASA
jgi:predicted RNA-binding Zn ribbon-like protein